MKLIGEKVGRLSDEIDRMLSIRADSITINESMEEYLIRPYGISNELMQSIPKNYLENTYGDKDWFDKSKSLAMAMLMTISKKQSDDKAELDSAIKEMLEQILGFAAEANGTNIETEKIAMVVNLDMFMPNVTMYDNRCLENQYMKKIKFPIAPMCKYKIVNIQYMPGMIFWDNEYKEDGYEYFIPLGCCKEKILFPSIVNNKENIDEIIKSLMPLEMNDAKVAVSHAKGKVLAICDTFAYFSYFAHLKDDVEEVVLLDENKELNFVSFTLTNQFDNPEKIKIISENIIDYLKKHAEEFDMIYISRRGTIGEYIYIRDVEKEKSKKIYWHYCDLGTYLEQVKNSIWNVIGDEVYNEQTNNHEDYLIVKDRLKDFKLSNPDVLRKLFMQNYIKDIF